MPKDDIVSKEEKDMEISGWAALWREIKHILKPFKMISF